MPYLDHNNKLQDCKVPSHITAPRLQEAYKNAIKKRLTEAKRKKATEFFLGNPDLRKRLEAVSYNKFVRNFIQFERDQKDGPVVDFRCLDIPKGKALVILEGIIEKEQTRLNQVQRETKFNEDNSSTRFVAEVKERIEGTLICTEQKETNFGQVTNFTDDSGNLYSTWGNIPVEFEVGKRVSLRFTVYKHNSHRGEKINMINRLAVQKG